MLYGITPSSRLKQYGKIHRICQLTGLRLVLSRGNRDYAAVKFVCYEEMLRFECFSVANAGNSRILWRAEPLVKYNQLRRLIC